MIWDKKYETGIVEIDQQHIKWISLITKFLDALLVGELKQKIDEIFEDTYQYTQTHLAFEEKLMANNNYPDLKRHKKLHDDLIVRLNDLKKKLKGKNYVNSDMIEFCNLLQTWLVNHIENEDKKYVPFIKEDENNAH